MKQWNQGYRVGLDSTREYQPANEMTDQWWMGYLAAKRDIARYGRSKSTIASIKERIEDIYEPHIKNRLSRGWSLMEATSIPDLGPNEWKIQKGSEFSATTEVNGQPILIGDYRSPKEALAVLKKNESILLSGHDVDPNIKTIHTEKLYSVWGISDHLREWSEALNIKERTISQRASRKKITIEEDIAARLIEIVRITLSDREFPGNKLSFAVYTKFIYQCQDIYDIHPAIGPFKLDAPISYWCCYMGITENTARRKAKLEGMALEEYLINIINKKLSGKKKEKEGAYVSTTDIYRYCQEAEERLKTYPGRGLFNVCFKNGVYRLIL